METLSARRPPIASTRGDPRGRNRDLRRDLSACVARSSDSYFFPPASCWRWHAGGRHRRRVRARNWWISVRLPVFAAAAVWRLAAALLVLLLTSRPAHPARAEAAAATSGARQRAEAVSRPQRPHHHGAHRRAAFRFARGTICRGRRRQRHHRQVRQEDWNGVVAELVAHARRGPSRRRLRRGHRRRSANC